MKFEYSFGIKVVEVELAGLFSKKITDRERIILLVERLKIL